MTHRLTQERRDSLAKMYAKLVAHEFLVAVTPEHELITEDDGARSTFEYGFANGALFQFMNTLEQLGIEFGVYYESPAYKLKVLYISADKYYTSTYATFSLDGQAYSVYDWDSTREKWERAIARAKKIARDLGKEDYPKYKRSLEFLPQA